MLQLANLCKSLAASPCSPLQTVATLTCLLSTLNSTLLLTLQSDDDFESESARKKAEADRLRAAEKFMVIGSGTAQCKGCGYEYSPEKGDPDFPVSRGTRFQVGLYSCGFLTCLG